MRVWKEEKPFDLQDLTFSLDWKGVQLRGLNIEYES